MRAFLLCLMACSAGAVDLPNVIFLDARLAGDGTANRSSPRQADL
jgi:hypothetical protein